MLPEPRNQGHRQGVRAVAGSWWNMELQGRRSHCWVPCRRQSRAGRAAPASPCFPDVSPLARGSLVSASLWLLLLRPSRFSRVRLCATLWTAAHQAPLSTGFSRQEYWSGLPFPSDWLNLCKNPGDKGDVEMQFREREGNGSESRRDMMGTLSAQGQTHNV